jgi:DNA-binding transcriptional MerR regulator
MEELARLAGITVRTLRFYRERKLIPPPRREGRIAWYDDTTSRACARSPPCWSAVTR